MNIRNKIYWLGVMLSLLILSGCDDSSLYMAGGWDLDTAPHYLLVETENLIFESSSYETPIVISTNEHWTISSPNKWITFSETSGIGNQTVIASISAFPDSTIRQGMIIVRGSVSGEKQLAVTQTCDNYQPWLSFTSDGPQTLQFTYEVPTLEYSVNGSEWMGLGTNEVTFGGNNGELRLRGKCRFGTIESKFAYYDGLNAIKFGTDCNVSCRGDIRTLVDYENYTNADCKDARFSGLFDGCHQLITAPDLPITTLADNCYTVMFQDCSLSSAPELPATTLADCCYYGMFSCCKSLKAAPKLPAMSLSDSCYFAMFNWCSSLVLAPELPATKLADHCCEDMFIGCTSLTAAPELPATMLADGCYTRMFYGCSSLLSAPVLPATIMAKWCYAGLFFGCTKIKDAPELPAHQLAEGCYSNMFRDCTSLTTAPDLPATTLASKCYFRMFEDCSSLTSTPELQAITLESNCYAEMFYGCKNLHRIKMLATDINAPDCLLNWTNGVSPTGTFIKNAAATWNSAGVVPNGWNVITE